MAEHSTFVKKPCTGGHAAEHAGHAESTLVAMVEAVAAAEKVPAAHGVHVLSAVAVEAAL